MKAFDNHLLMMYNCPRRGYYADVLKLNPTGDAPALIRGIFFHDVCEQALQAYRKGADKDDVLKAAKEYANLTWPEKAFVEGKIDKNSTILALMLFLTTFLNKYTPKDIYIVEEQISFMIADWVYVCNIDIAVRQTSGAYSALDIKTSTQAPGARYRDFWALQPGITGYAIGLAQHDQSIPIEQYSIAATHIRLLKSGPNIECKDYTFMLTQEKQSIWWTETVQRIKDIEAIRNGSRIPVMDTSCCFEYNTRCPYFTLCEQGVNSQTLTGFTKATWNPITRQMEETK